MELFDLINGHVFPSKHALLISPYKEIWENDTSEGREKSMKWFTYIELVCSPKKSNPFYGYSEEIRPSKVKKEVFGDENYEIEDELMIATIAYKEHLSFSSPTYSLCVDAEVAVDKLKRFLREFNLNSRSPTGALLLKPRDLQAVLDSLPNTIKALQETRDKVHDELIADAKTRGDRKVGFYER